MKECKICLKKERSVLNPNYYDSVFLFECLRCKSHEYICGGCSDVLMGKDDYRLCNVCNRDVKINKLIEYDV